MKSCSSRVCQHCRLVVLTKEFVLHATGSVEGGGDGGTDVAPSTDIKPGRAAAQPQGAAFPDRAPSPARSVQGSVGPPLAAAHSSQVAARSASSAAAGGRGGQRNQGGRTPLHGRHAAGRLAPPSGGVTKPPLRGGACVGRLPSRGGRGHVGHHTAASTAGRGRGRAPHPAQRAGSQSA